jgi:TAP-like protein.
VCGEFDQATPVADARAAAGAWPDATYVQVPNTSHITALADFQGCASTIARRFLRTLNAGDTSCVARMPAVQAPRVFPALLAAAPRAQSAGHDDRSTPADRRAAWATAWTIGDAYARWLNVLYGGVGVGLRGGRYTMHGSYYGLGDLTIDLTGVRFVHDLAIDGTATWGRMTRRIRATVRVEGPNGLAGRLWVSFSTHAPGAIAMIRGRLNGMRIDLSTPAAWSPQG